MGSPFKYGHASAPNWTDATQSCLAQLGGIPEAANLGFIYVTDMFAGNMQEILATVKLATGISHWVGSTGIGVCASSTEYLDKPAIAIMLGEFPAQSFSVIHSLKAMEDLQDKVAAGTGEAYFGIVHVDPENQHMPALIVAFAKKMASGFLVGGLTSSRNENVHVADEVTHGGLSGVVFAADVALSTRLTQGVSPLGKLHEVTEGGANVIARIDDKPAFDVLTEEIGEVLSRDLSRLSGYIFVGLSIPGSDTGDYVVRNLVGIDVDRKMLAIGDSVENGRTLLFCRRDGSTAVQDMQRMLDEIKAGISKPVRGAIYFSCLGRGESMFGPDSEELKMISRTLGEIPLVGFFANGEISHDRIYGYTGVLTVFL